MSSHGFTITRHYLGLSTAWRAEYTHRGKEKTYRTIGINSEMDALLIGGKRMHACGHNLIAMAGCAVAIALKAALQAHDVSGAIVLLGTPGKLYFFMPFQTVVHNEFYSGRGRRWENCLAGERRLRRYGCVFHVRLLFCIFISSRNLLTYIETGVIHLLDRHTRSM